MFIDVARIDLKAGKGGDGAVSFRREKYEPSGGPYGGDGGKGGDIVLLCDEGQRTLADFKYKRYYHAQNGENGKTKMQYGKSGADLILKVPQGTLVKDFESNKVIYDLKEPGERFVICHGGRGGRGNAKFKTSIRQAPRFAEPGEPGEEKIIKLEIKLLSDVGLIGLPNVGKSTLLSVMTNANPKIANYHFTTIDPNLGVVSIGPGESFVMADIPGLIEGASEGKGIGIEFLKHIERCRVLVHVIDISGQEGRDPWEDYCLIRNELSKYDSRLNEKKEIICANKMDLPDSKENLEKFKKHFKDDIEIFEISAIKHENLNLLKFKISEILKNTEKEYTYFDERYVEPEKKEVKDFEVIRYNDCFIVKGPLIDHLVYRTDFNIDESVKHFQKIMEDKKIIEALKNKGIQEGHLVIMNDVEFEYYE